MSKYVFGGQKEVLRPSGLPYQYKARFSMIGTVASGKSTVAAGIVITAQTLVHEKNSGFLCRFLEGNSNILDDASNLRSGIFPKKTQPFQPVAREEAGLLMLWEKWRGTRKIQIPICDVAGEDIQGMIKRVGVSPPDGRSYMESSALMKYVLNSDGFIVVIPASRALLWEEDFQLEHEMPELAHNPDTNLARILGEIFTHKDRTGGRPLKGIAVVITKWDMLRPYAVNRGLRFYDDDENVIQPNIDRFMELCFPATSTELKASRLSRDKLQYFPSHFQVLIDDEGKPLKWPDGSYRIQNKILQNRRVPVYSEKSYIKLFAWLRQFAQ